jgi:serine/threonine protein kinase
VAIKVINRAFTANAAAVERFRREVRAAARLSHPHIVTAHDAEQTGDALFLVTEYVHGISLGRLVRERGPLPIAEACDYIRQAALGLQHAHERGMVHRDIKPDNLMRGEGRGTRDEHTKELRERDEESSEGRGAREEGREADSSPLVSRPSSLPLLVPRPSPLAPQIKVLDFGLAVLAVERRNGLTAEDAIVGTPDYMAPEQAEDSHAADIRSDIYSLGCSLYVLLTGNVPYPAETPLLKILAHRDRPLPSLRTLRPDAPPELAAVLARMMAKKPQDRFQTPGEVATALAPFVGHVSNVPPGKARWKRAPRYLLAASLFAALLLAGGVVYRIQTDKGELVIKTESDDVEVVIKQSGEQIDIIDTKTKKSIRLRSGEYDLKLKDAPGLKLDLEKATLRRGETTLATIQRSEIQTNHNSVRKNGRIELLQRVAIPAGNGRYFTAVSATGKYFALEIAGSIWVWDGQTGKQVYHTNGWSPYFTTDGERFMFAKGTELKILEVAGWKYLPSIVVPRKLWGFHTLTNSHYIMAWGEGFQMHLLNPVAGKPVESWSYEGYEFPRYTATADGKYLLVKPTGERNYRVISLSGEEPGERFKHILGCDLILWHFPVGEHAVIRNEDKLYRVRVSDGKRLGTVTAIHDRGVGGEGQFDWSTDLRGFSDGTLRLSDRLTGEEHATFLMEEGENFGEMGSIRLSPDGRFACVATTHSVSLFRLSVETPTKDKP